MRRRGGGQAVTPNTDFQLINPGDPPSKLTKQLLDQVGATYIVRSDHLLIIPRRGLEREGLP